MSENDKASFHLRNRAPRSFGGKSLPLKNKNKKKSKPGEDAFDRMIEEADYEVQHDPYRGMAAMQDKEAKHSHPWRRCAFGSSLELDDDDLEPTDHGSNLVRSVCQSTCPTLIRWANEANEKQKSARKRKRSAAKTNEADVFPGRPEDPKLRCECDYNPFCLGTLGGVMNEALTERLKLFQHETDYDEVVEVDKEGNSSPYDPNSPSSVYSETTSKQLKELRKVLVVDKEPVRSFLTETLKDMTGSVSVDESLHSIESWHQSLLFVNPLEDKKEDTETTVSLRLSLPPGIENLGATCYLNTQLQCLAQNLVFLEGIFSWCPPSSSSDEDRMTSVIRLFQQLLARMNAGPLAVLNTVEFSNALGLDHFEQQDPNEFSRLLFDKLHESFQQSSNTVGNGCDLAGLLPHLFQGMTVYETTCLTCKAKSQRKEEFMDLNLPIIDPSVASRQKTGKKHRQLSILETLTFTKTDVDVQQCLDSYCGEEFLEEDNQYLCSACGCKRDAKREMSFEKLPPVLNVQLSRYVFDRATLMKKKLENKVLLPLELSVNAKGKIRKDGLVKHRYVLVAVMRHKGKSAYSGHYVAEAMDWLTGRWFEFNDETVSFLESGPSCSFKPGAKRKGPQPAGSTDAYNMYYVEETFLAQSTLERLRRQSSSSPDDTAAALNLMAVDRSTRYSDIAQTCLDDARVWDRLNRRRTAIMDVLPGIFNNSSTEFVWVDADQLRRFLSCQELYSVSVFSLAPLPFQHQKLLCSHSKPGIHPRLARRGKLLPKDLYDAFVSILRNELGPEIFTESLAFTPPNLFCYECCEDYRQDLSRRVDLAVTLRRLYNALDPKEDTFSLDCDPGEVFANDADQYAYILSKKFVSWFRKQCELLMKKSGAIDATKHIDGIESGRPSSETLAEGLDALDMSFLEARVPVDSEEGICVNGYITCEHGNCTTSSKRSIRYVPWSVWHDIETLFPWATMHMRMRIEFGEIQNVSDDTFGCSRCEDRANSASEKRQRLSGILGSMEKTLRRDFLTPESLLETEVKNSGAGRYRLLYEDDVAAWKKFTAAAKRDISNGESVIEDGTRNLLLPKEKWDSSLIRSLQSTLDDDSTSSNAQYSQFLPSVMRPIACSKHKLPIRAALVQNPDCTNAPPCLLKSNLCVLSETKYRSLVSNWMSVCSEMFGAKSQAPIQVPDGESSDEDSEFFQGEFKWHHPALVCFTSRTKPDSTVAVISDKIGMRFKLDSCLCGDPECNEEFVKWRKAEDVAKSAKEEKNSVFDFDATERKGMAADDPIPVDCVVDTSITKCSGMMRVVEAEKEASIDSILESLALSSGSPSSSQAVRRSTRKRKLRYHTGVIVSEDNLSVNLKLNVAALRLLLVERCAQFELSHRLQLLVPIPSYNNGQSPTVEDKSMKDLPDALDSQEDPSSKLAINSKVIDLSLSCSEDILEDLIKSSLEVEADDLYLLLPDLLIVRQADDDPGINDIPKDALLDYLIGLSNATTLEESKPQKKRKARIEKGFSGTFLAARSSVSDEGEKKSAELDADSDVEMLDVTGNPVAASDSKPEARRNGHVDGNNSKPKDGDHWKQENDCVLDVEMEEPMLVGTKGKVDSEVDSWEGKWSNIAEAPRHLNENGTSHGQEREEASSRAMNLVEKLLSKNPDIVESKNESLLYDAALWAIKDGTRLDYDEDALLDHAFAKYVEFVVN